MVAPDAGSDCASLMVGGAVVDATELGDGSGICPASMMALRTTGTSPALVTGPGGSQGVSSAGVTVWSAPGTLLPVHTRVMVARDGGDFVGYLPSP